MDSLAGVGLFVVAALVLWYNKKGLPKPPGPRGLPFIGNLLDLPNGRDWEMYAIMGERYGPLISLTVGQTTVVVINSLSKAKDILDKKGPIYSSRPFAAMAGRLMGWEKSTGFLEYGPIFKQTKKMFHQELGSVSAIKSFWPQEEAQARKFLELCTDRPDRLLGHCYQHAGAIILRIAHGYAAANYDDEMVATTNKAMDTFSAASKPGAFLVNHLPFLRHLPEWLPGAGFKRVAREWAPLYLDMVDIPMNYVREQLKAGTAEDSFTAKWLKRDLSEEDTEILRHASGALLGAGSETTAITLHCFFLMMARHPDIQRKAQAEIEDICGCDRLPTFTDRKCLPYVEAIVKEVTRIHQSVPLGLPHTVTEDDMHDGYYIPKGSIVFANIWQMAHDRHIYPRPFVFDPERFMGPKLQQDPYEMVFGFGRRLCPGRLLADSTLFITMAMCLSAFDILPATDDMGIPIIPEIDSKAGIISALKDFKLTLTPRLSVEQFNRLVGLQ